ncbi:molybdenum cofactor sulfurase-like [Cornus florida]|uniref:molybdenum cofactor sulfurase-like n=1 Tax=Cornus florida TaxID=4283 RepID=UPI0028A18DB1|nr:molybdenum cofactor sulfurase-like [Cornus florida]
MQSPCIREASKACFHGCCPAPFLGLPEPHNSTSKPPNTVTAFQYDFTALTASSLQPNTHFSNHESLPLLEESVSIFNKVYPQYSQTDQADQIRANEYYHLSSSSHVCLDYIGHSLFSYSQQQSHCPTASIASSSTSPPPLLSNASNVPFFDVHYKSVNLHSQIHYGGQESEFESKIRKRIMSFMNISEDDYSIVFTANQSSAFKLLADSYPFHHNENILTVYDYENEAVEAMIKTSKKRGARVSSAEFSWPSLRIQSGKLRKLVGSKNKRRKKGLFVFPLQSRMTGARYSYLWMSLAQENGWHVMLDASALGAKDMETLGLSLFQPDFLVCSFFKIFGENPSGFGCLFVKKSSASVFNDSNTATSIGIVSLVPATIPVQSLEESAITDQELGQTSKIELQKEDLAETSSISTSKSVQQSTGEISELHDPKEVNVKQKEISFSEIVELDKPPDTAQFTSTQTSIGGRTDIECRGLDHADSLGLILISTRARYLVNWLVNALMSLRHPHSENGLLLVRIYGPKIKFNRGPAVAFNVFDWKGEKIDPSLVQKLADRSSISLSYGFLHHIWFSEKYEEERESIIELRSTEEEETMGNKKRKNYESGISVVTASLGFLTNFEDVYRLWSFVSRFLDADFVEKERWRYKALNQTTIEV